MNALERARTPKNLYKKWVLNLPIVVLKIQKNSASYNKYYIPWGSSKEPLISVLSGSGLVPITYKQFRVFPSRVVSKLRLDPSLFSPRSFRRGGATLAFDCHIPSEIIKLQGDGQSDAYLVYLELSQPQKQCAAHAMAHKLQSMFSA